MMMNYFLKEMAPEDKPPIRIPLFDTEMCIGRTNTSSLKNYPKVSRRHALFMKNNNTWAIKDLDSRNALYVNFTQMDRKWRALTLGDVIGFGTSSLDDKAGFICTLSATVQIKQEPTKSERRRTSLALTDEENDDDCVIVKDPSQTASKIECVSSDVKSEVDSDISIDDEIISLESWNVTETSEVDSDNSIDDEVSSPESWNVTETSQIVNSETIDDKTGSLNVAENSPNVKFEVIDNESGLLEPLNLIENSKNINLEAINDETGLLEPLSVTETLPKIKIKAIEEENGPLNVTETLPKIKIETIDEETGPLNITETSPNVKSHTVDNEMAELQPLNVAENSQIVSSGSVIKFQKSSDTTLKNETVSFEKLRVTGLSYIKVEQGEDIEYNAANTKHGTNCDNKSSYVNFNGPQEIVTPKRVSNEKDIFCSFYENDQDSGDSARYFNWEDLPSPDKLYRKFQGMTTLSTNDTSSSVTTTEPIVSFTPTCVVPKIFVENKLLYDENSIIDLNVSNNFLKNSSTMNLCKPLCSPPRDTELQVIRHCSVKLVKCDSKYFDWPPDVKSELNNCFRKNKKISETRRKRSSADSITLDLSHRKETIETRYYMIRNVPEITGFGHTSLVERTTGDSLSKFSIMESSNSEHDQETEQKALELNTIKGCRPEMKVHEPHQHSESRDNSLFDLNYEQNKRNDYNSVAEHSCKFSKRRISQSDKNPSIRPRKVKKCQSILEKSISIAKSKNTTGKVRFIEPMPITRRPKYVRGREEWFPERYGSVVASFEDENVTMDLDDETIENNSTTDEFDTQNNYESTHGNEQNSYKNTRRNEQKFYEIDHRKERRNYESTRCNKQKFNESTTNVELPDSDKTNYDLYVGYLQRTRPAVARRPDKYGSRMSFLMDAEKATNTRPKRNKLPTKHKITNRRDKVFDSTIVKACTPSRATITDHTHSMVGHNPSMTDNPSLGGGKKETIDDIVAFIRNFRQQSNTDKPPLREPKKLQQNPRSASASEIDSSDNRKVAIIAPRTVASSVPSKVETRIKTLISEKNSCDYSVIPIIVQILNWSPKWLEEQNSNTQPPPPISQTVKPLSLWYKSFEAYADAYTPAVLLDIWEMLYQNYTPVSDSNNTKTFYFSINTIRTNNAVMELQCRATFSGNDSSRPTEGSVVLLIATEKRSGSKVTLFGYIHTHESGACNYIPQKSDFRSELSSQDMMNPVIFSVFVKKRFNSLQQNTVNIAYSIVNIRDKIHLVEALDILKVSPLSKAIFKPNRYTLTMCDRSSPDEVENVKNQILRLGPKVIIVNTPAATGKTSLIVQLIDSLHNDVKNTKVWVCSSSVTTLDEIGLRLVKHQNDIPYSVEFVRTGPCLDMHPELVCNSLSRKVSDLLGKDTAQRIEKIQALECQINDILFQMPKSGDETGNNSSLQLIINEYRALKEESLNPLNSSRKKFEQKVLKDSLVIMSTLDRAMELRTGTRPTCCIVDEAQQCSELDVLQCLISGVEKLVLIGDIYQMPPKVLSKHALKHGYGRSMFERFCSISQRLFMRDPVLTVNHQHRMHREICLFSSTYFYQRRLIPSTVVNHNWPLQPYLLYDIVIIEKNVDVQMKAGWKEAMLRFMCSKILLLCPTATLGLVTSAKDVGPCASFFSQNALFRDVEVNTVDKFQGREKDIVILFHIAMQDGVADYVECERRLNVAMTRARHSLIIFGHLSSLTVHFRHWKALLEDAKMRCKYVGIASLKHIPAVFGQTIKR